MKPMLPHFSKEQITASIVLLLLTGSISYFSYSLYKKSQFNFDTALNISNETITALNERITILTEENKELSTFLTEGEKKNLELEREKRRNEREIDKLEKLTTIDPELLKKYSKVFFLSENYSPPEVEDVKEEYKITPGKDLQILEDVEPFLHDMLEDANEESINLRVISAYRSFETQMQLKSNYVTTYGSGANQFSADQGYSEHQLGTTVDFGTPEVTGAYMSFENTTAFTWLKLNAHKYGFILSYPSGNSYYQYEPWHWRFVGKELADDLFDDKKSFYELDQREIDKYLLEIFDK